MHPDPILHPNLLLHDPEECSMPTLDSIDLQFQDPQEDVLPVANLDTFLRNARTSSQQVTAPMNPE